MSSKQAPRTVNQRSAGVLLHVSSLANKYHIGDLGACAYQFVDFLAESGQTWWQLLPMNPIGPGNSPYMTSCSLAGEPLYIDLQWLVQQKLLTTREIRPKAKSVAKAVNFQKAKRFRLPLLELAYSRFKPTAAFRDFCAAQQSWLHDFALFEAACHKFGTNEWHRWPEGIRQREAGALAELADECQESIGFNKFMQFCFFTQWQKLKTYANKKGIGLIGDIPIFVSYQSSDVWANQDYFWLDADGKMQFVAGVPPDYFNPTGQLWGNALYKWDTMEHSGFEWWCDRFAHMMQHFDMIRIDHFIGFHRYWEIKATAKTARKGTWRYTPGEKLFNAVLQKFGRLPIIAEDLGLVVPEVVALREKFSFPGMKVLQFGFGNNDDAPLHIPHAFDRNFVVYTGTHDNDTALGWYRTAKKQARIRKPSYDFGKIQSYFGIDESEVAKRMMSDVLKSTANLCIVPMQDILELDGKSRMNVPGTPSGNWRWRMTQPKVMKTKSKWLQEITRSTGRSR